MLAHLIRSDAFHASVTPERIAATRTAYRTGWFAYFFATLLALVLPLASFVAYIAVAIYYLIPRGVDDDITTRRLRKSSDVSERHHHDLRRHPFSGAPRRDEVRDRGDHD